MLGPGSEGADLREAQVRVGGDPEELHREEG